MIIATIYFQPSHSSRIIPPITGLSNLSSSSMLFNINSLNQQAFPSPSFAKRGTLDRLTDRFADFGFMDKLHLMHRPVFSKFSAQKTKSSIEWQNFYKGGGFTDTPFQYFSPKNIQNPTKLAAIERYLGIPRTQYKTNRLTGEKRRRLDPKWQFISHKSLIKKTSLKLNSLFNIDTQSFKQRQEKAWETLSENTRKAFENNVSSSAFSNESAACFHEIKCADNTRVYKYGVDPSKEYHANNISIVTPRGDKSSVIAMQQPKNINESCDRLKGMLGEQHIHKVFDLRSSEDMKRPETVDYNKKSGFESIDFREERSWGDFQSVDSVILRDLRKEINKDLEDNKSIAVHCRAGIGRTGTLLAYTHLYNQFKQSTPRSKREALNRIIDGVVELRTQRAEGFVQTQSQFNLLIDTLLKDFDIR